MIILGGPGAMIPQVDSMSVYNFSSMVEGVPRLNLMPPVVERTADFQFDLYYANWLLSDPMAFRDLMRVLYDVYSGMDVYLCCGSMNIVGDLNESFAKFIQQRYGINCCIVNDNADLEAAVESSFTIEGIANFDMDKERASAIAVESVESGNSTGYGFILGGYKKHDKSVGKG